MKREVDEFSRKYDAYVVPSSRMHRRVKRLDYKLWSESNADMFQTIPYEQVKCVEIHMPEDRFRALLEHDRWLETAGRPSEHINNNVARVSVMIREHERESRIRHENDSVRAAYEKYQTLLRLVDSYYD